MDTRKKNIKEELFMLSVSNLNWLQLLKLIVFPIRVKVGQIPKIKQESHFGELF